MLNDTLPGLRGPFIAQSGIKQKIFYIQDVCMVSIKYEGKNRNVCVEIVPHLFHDI